MKKLVLMSRNWIKVATSKTVGRLGDLIDNFSSGGTPFAPVALPLPFSSGAAREYESMRAQQDFAYRASLAGQAGMMGGFRGYLPNQMLGAKAAVPQYHSRKPDNILKEGLMDLNVKFTRVDKEHVLVEVACLKHVVHSKRELEKLAARLIAEHAEQYLWGEQPKDPRAPTKLPETSKDRLPPGGAMNEKEEKT